MYSFTRNWHLPFLNQRRGENDHRKYFMISLHKRMLPDLGGIKPMTSWSPVWCAIILDNLILLLTHNKLNKLPHTWPKIKFCLFAIAYLPSKILPTQNSFWPLGTAFIFLNGKFTVITLISRTNRPEQTVQTQIRLLSSLDIHCMPFHLHILGSSFRGLSARL